MPADPVRGEEEILRFSRLGFDAMQWDGTAEGVVPIAGWLDRCAGGQAVYRADLDPPVLDVTIGAGTAALSAGDWVTRETKGAFGVLSQESFAAATGDG